MIHEEALYQMYVPLPLRLPGVVKGAALYAYNDAVFSEDDWKGIRMLLQSVKQNDPHKVGYFGMGFKSVFHLTGKLPVLSHRYTTCTLSNAQPALLHCIFNSSNNNSNHNQFSSQC